MKRRRGFALHVVLWIILVAGLVALVASVVGRDEFDAAANRLAMERAHWSAVACAEGGGTSVRVVNEPLNGSSVPPRASV